MSDKTIVLIIGLIAGLLLCCSSGLIFLAAGAPRPATEISQPPAAAVIEADITEDFLNRTFAQNVGGGNGSVPIADGRVDIQPGNRLKFVAQLDTPIGLMTTRGAITIAVKDGRLAFRITDVRLGDIPVTPLAAPFLPAIESQVNEQANRQLAERTALAKVRLLDVTSDDTQLKFYLAGK